MSELVPTIGLEIHAELRTKTKMFCNSINNPNEKTPNTNVCPVCMAHPGTLPTINKEAVRAVLRVGAAVGGTLADYSEFDRKNYFYPDIPKAYQLSQYEFPLVEGGSLHGVDLTRIHLEEDTARSSHTESATESFVDFNRAGVPLMELVTEPVIHSGEAAGAFARELQLLLRTLGVSHANMEKGEMRVEVNLSLAPLGAPFGTKVEVKNLNSFRAVERAIAYEIKRQTALLKEGGNVVQETRGWDENKGETFSQRVKEEAADYRYFPDPDLPKLKLSELPEMTEEVLRNDLPELPWDKRARLADAFGLKNDTLEALVADVELGAFFDEVVAAATQEGHDVQTIAKLAANYITNNLVACEKPEGKHVTSCITPQTFVQIVELNSNGELSSNGVVELLQYAVLNTSEMGDIRSLAAEKGLMLQNDPTELLALVEAVLGENEAVIAEYKAGKEQALQYLVGQCMKASKGSGNPEKIKDILLQKLK